MSVAPEIAGLAEPFPLVPARAGTASTALAPAAQQTAPATALTLGALAGQLRSIASAPERWWGLVRFEPDRSVKIMVEESASHQAWLVVLPPGAGGHSCDCEVATVIAGEATEGSPASAVLRPGPVRVHGERHRLRGLGAGYSISLHARARRPGSAITRA